jgi:transcriptional regulator of acetoin/glycerol metabolism
VEAARGSGTPVSGSFRQEKGEVIRDFERTYLLRLLAEAGGNVSEAARRAGMKRSALHRLLARHGIHTTEFKK